MRTLYKKLRQNIFGHNLVTPTSDSPPLPAPPPPPILLPPDTINLTSMAPASAVKAWLSPILAAPRVSIAAHAHRLHGEDTFAGHTVVVLSLCHADGNIDSMVRYLLEHFRLLQWKIVISSATKLCDDDLPLLDGLVYRTCAGDAFTAWKAALHCFPSLRQAENIIFCNDSVFGPIGSVWPMHDAMAAQDCDFWGATYTRTPIPHLQDFYLVFRQTALANSAFADFFSRIPLEYDPNATLSMGDCLGLWLEHHGLRSAAFSGLSPTSTDGCNPVHRYWKEYIDAGVPFMKKELLFHNPLLTSTYKWAAVTQSYGYPLQLLFETAWKDGLDLTPCLCDGHRTWQWPSDVLVLQDAIDLNTVDMDALPDNLSPLGVFVHVYYVHLLSELCLYLENFPRTAHVYISTDTEEKAEQIREAWGALGFDVMTVRVLPNRGWDIAPFLLGFADVLPQYPVLVRLHAKASPQLPTHVGDEWRHTLFSALAGSPDRVRRLQALFAQNIKLGMIVPPPVAWYAANIDMAGNYNHMQRLLEPSGIRIDADSAIDFPMGSMFWCRSETLRPWLEQHLSFDDFEPSDTKVVDGSLAHALERLFLFGCGIAQKRWGRVAPAGHNRLAPNMPSTSTPKQDRAKVICHISSVDTPPLGSAVTILPAQGRPELVVILPFISPRLFSGGPNTALLFAAEFAKRGYNIHCLAESPPTCSSDRLRQHLCKLLDMGEELAAKFRVSCLSCPVSLHENDRLLATAWKTSEVANTLTKRMEIKRFCYFIQDFEPLFDPWNESHAGAMLSYGHDCLPVINEPSLAEFCFMLRPGRFAARDFCDATQVFTPAVDRRYFYPEKHEGKHTLLFYARPTQERNLYRYGREAIARLVHKGVLEADTWDVHLMGDDTIPSIDFGKGVVSHTLPWMGFTAYAAHVRQASVGLSLMLSPHTSYMPLELAAAGVPVVTTTYLNKDTECLRALSPHIIGVDPTIEAVTSGLREAICMAAQRHTREDALKVPAHWHEAFAPILPRCLHFMETGE